MVSQFIFSQVRRRRWSVSFKYWSVSFSQVRRRWSVSFKYWSVSFSQVRRRWSVTVSRRGQSAPGVCYSLSVVSRQRGYRLWQRARLSVSVPVSVSAISVSASQSCVDAAAAVSQCVQHADSQSSRCRVSMLPLCLSVFSMRTVSLHVVVCRCCCRCVSVCSACGQSVFTLSCVDAAAAVSQCVQHADSQSSRCRVSMLPLCLSVFSMRTVSLHVVVCRCCRCVSVCSACGQSVFTLSCVDAAAVSQCVQHADSQSSRCRVSMLPLCLSVFSMRTVSLHIVVCRCCRCVAVCSACGQSSLRSGLTEYNFIANC